MRHVEWTRVRWRMRGAWQWPVFVVLTAVEGVLLNELPISGQGPGGLVPGLLLAGFLNLIAIAALAPLAGRLLRRRRRDLPLPIAADYCGTALLACLLAVFVTAGLVHHDEVRHDEDAFVAQSAAVAHYVDARHPELRDALREADALRLQRDLYRTCIPAPDARRPLCLFVQTDQSPPGIRVDGDRITNATYRRANGFR